jgi:hypothetical protein
MSSRFLFSNVFALYGPGIDRQLPHHSQTFLDRQVAQITILPLLGKFRFSYDLVVGIDHTDVLPPSAERPRFAGPTSLAAPGRICHTSWPGAKPQAEFWPLFAHLPYFVGRVLCLAVVLGSLPGCATWDFHRWNLDNLRDDRARDIDSRLSEDRPIVKNPF